MTQRQRSILLRGSIFLIGLVIIVAIFWPRLHMSLLQLRLSNNALNTERAAAVATKILEYDPDRGAEVLAEFAATFRTMAFDPRHRVLLIHDLTTGDLHVLGGDSGGSYSAEGSEEPPPEALAILPKSDSVTLKIGKPPFIFKNVSLAASTMDRADFLLERVDGQGSHILRLTFDEHGRMNAMGFVDAINDEGEIDANAGDGGDENAP